MSLLKTRLIWTPTDPAIPQQDIDDYVNITIKIGLQAKLNQMDAKLTNAIGKYVGTDGNIQFQEGDSLKLYAKHKEDDSALDISPTSTDLIMSTELIEVEAETSDNSTSLTLKCADKTFTVLNNLWTSRYKTTDTDKNQSPEIIKNILQNVSDSTGDGSFSISALFTTESGFIQATKSDGSPFPIISMSKVYKPVYEWLTDLSNTDNTVDNKTYVFYIDELNRFHWFYPKDAAQTVLTSALSAVATTANVSSTTGFDSIGRIAIDAELMNYTGITATSFTGLTRGSAGTEATTHNINATVSDALRFIVGDTSTGNEVLNYKLTNKVFDVINFVIFNAGDDMNGVGISNYFFDPTSGSKTLKGTHRKFLKIAELMKEADRLAGNITRNADKSYNFPSVFPVTPAWNTTISVNSTIEYNNEFRETAIIVGKNQAKKITSFRGEARWKGDIETKGRNYVVGNLINFTSEQTGIKEIDIRIKDLTHRFTKNGWFTSLSVEEDERKIVV